MEENTFSNETHSLFPQIGAWKALKLIQPNDLAQARMLLLYCGFNGHKNIANVSGNYFHNDPTSGNAFNWTTIGHVVS